MDGGVLTEDGCQCGSSGAVSKIVQSAAKVLTVALSAFRRLNRACPRARFVAVQQRLGECPLCGGTQNILFHNSVTYIVGPVLNIFSCVLLLCLQILIGEAILYCYLSRNSSASQTEASINAAGCNFNSYIRRAVRFIGGRTNTSYCKKYLCSMMLYNLVQSVCKNSTNTK